MAKTLRECIKDAESRKVAIGHFNISDSEALRAVFDTARKLNVPVIIGTSEGEREFIGQKQAVAMVKSLREEFDYPIFINADHTYSLKKAKEAIDTGYDAVIFDGTKLPFEENIQETKKIVAYAKKESMNREQSVLIEGEIGFIGTSSKLLNELPAGVSVGENMLTKPEEVAQYVKETGVDLVAPAVGNIHGMLKHAKNPHLNIERIKALRAAANIPLVLHGGSGIPDDDFKKAIAAGISVIHINTEVRLAYREGIERGLENDKDEIAPYRLMKKGVENMAKVVEKRLRLFNNM
ncbi:class II fructose-bisphosphate aldolase [Candidatus Kaiserbacteria bacterium]|nr:class II fructose-bisphosphate aldolase [Candidatus Kaiserbacteria bacterium]